MLDHVRLYHFLTASAALDDISNRHVKISEIGNLNDPFELWCFSQSDRLLRTVLRDTRRQIGSRFGLLCFCEDWHNPLLWSHYADKHQGICLGFDVADEKVARVKYVSTRRELQRPLALAEAQRLLFTKYRGWAYEREWRGWFTLDERDPTTGLCYYNLDAKIALREVIAGPLCPVAKPVITEALSDDACSVRVLKSRLAFRSFRVVRDRRGFAERQKRILK